MITNIPPAADEEVLTKLSLLKSESVQLEKTTAKHVMKKIFLIIDVSFN